MVMKLEVWVSYVERNQCTNLKQNHRMKKCKKDKLKKGRLNKKAQEPRTISMESLEQVYT